jgi:hypothetical protein
MTNPATAPGAPAGTPAVTQPEPAPKVTPPAPASPAAAKPDPPGKVNLAVRWPMGSLTLPPLGSEPVIVITEEGTEVDEATAVRAREAAALNGLTLIES